MKKVLFGILIVFLGLISCNKNDFEQNSGIDDLYLKDAVALNEAGSAFAVGTHTFTELNLSRNRWGWAVNQGITESNTMTDVDGNVYRTVKIGEQVWLAENYRATKYSDGTNVSTNGTSFFYCMDEVYGGLYYYYVVRQPQFAPEGWRVSSFEDWKKLALYIGGTYNEYEFLCRFGDIAYKLKEVGFEHWQEQLYLPTPIIPATDEYGFTALPAGETHTPGESTVFSRGSMAYFWTIEGAEILMNCRNNRLEGYKPDPSQWTRQKSVRLIKDGPAAVGTTEIPIYMGAAKNDIAKGTLVGKAIVTYDGTTAKIKYVLDGYTMNEVHIYANDAEPTTIAPGQYGFTQMFGTPVSEFETEFEVTDAEDDGIWLILHAVVNL